MNTLFLVYLIVEAIFGIGFLFVPDLVMDPMGLTLDETSTTFARMVGSLIISLPVLLFFARKSASSEFKRGVVYCIFTYLLASTIILLITQIKGLMNAMGWSVVILHLVFLFWFGYYLVNQGKMDSSR
jgi:tellurite resistance protein TehA-like permease